MRFGNKIEGEQAEAAGQAVMLGSDGKIPAELLPETGGSMQISVVDTQSGYETILNKYTDAATISQMIQTHQDETLLLNFVMGPDDFDTYYIGAVVLFPGDSTRAAHGTVTSHPTEYDYLPQALCCSVHTAEYYPDVMSYCLLGVGYQSGNADDVNVDLSERPIRATIRTLSTSGGGGSLNS